MIVVADREVSPTPAQGVVVHIDAVELDMRIVRNEPSQNAPTAATEIEHPPGRAKVNAYVGSLFNYMVRTTFAN